MKNSELRCGNCINHKGHKCRVYSVIGAIGSISKEYDGKETVDIETVVGLLNVPTVELFPIEIDEIFLECNGFEKCRITYAKKDVFNNKKGITIERFDGLREGYRFVVKYTTNCELHGVAEINYVHEYQNFLSLMRLDDNVYIT